MALDRQIGQWSGLPLNNLDNGHVVFFSMKHPRILFFLSRRLPGSQDLDVIHRTSAYILLARKSIPVI